MTTSTPQATMVGHQLTVVDVIDETPDAKSIVLRAPDDAGELFSYRPGQFLTFRIPSDLTGHVARSYSLSSAPGIDHDLKVTVKRTSDGYGSNWMCDNVAPGSSLTVLPPSGVFTPADYERDLLLFAGGSGITPVMSILRTALLRAECSVTLFYANRDEDSIIFRRELGELAAAYPDRLEVRHWLDVRDGHPSAEVVADFAAAHTSSEVFTCGPGPFMDAVGEGLRDAGVPKDQQHREVFLSLTGDPFEAPELAPASEAGSTVDTVVHLDGESHSFPWPDNQTLVDTLLDRGVDVPYSCRSAECGSCACTVVSGSVDMANSDILDPEDVADGFILGCQSRPRTGPIEIEF